MDDHLGGTAAGLNGVVGPTSSRELVVLGTASQVPTRHRNHVGAVLRWEDEAILFDPGEGTQRQLLLAGVSAPSITRVCLTHLHGDHSLGLPGVFQRMALDGVSRPIDLHFPAGGAQYVERLLGAVPGGMGVDVRLRPVTGDGVVAEGARFALLAGALEHRIETYGYRLQEPDDRRMLPERLAEAGVEGPAIGILQRNGELLLDGRRLLVEDFSVPRRGQAVAYVMDTRWCEGAVALARDADLLACEATFLERDADLAHRYQHLTAAQAGRLAATAGARKLVLLHFSQRYTDGDAFAEEASREFADVVAASDLDRIPVPRRAP